MIITIEGVLIVVGWLTSFLVALLVVPKLAAKRTMGMFGLEKVTNNAGEDVYAVVGPDGQAIKIPVGMKEVDGHQEPVLDYAGLAYSLPYIAGLHAAQQVKIALFSEKGVIARRLNKAGMAEALQGGDLENILPFLPKKAQGAIAILRALGIGIGKPGQGVQGSSDNGGYVRLQQ